MGYNAYNYFGAYIEMPEVEKKETNVIRRCSDVKCSNHKNEKMSKEFHFCNKCGTEIEEKEVEVTKSKVINYYNFAEEQGFDPELFSQVQTNYLIPNRRFGSVASWDENEEVAIELDWGDSRKAIVEYTKQAAEFIKQVKAVYGIELEVKFGVISYIM